MIRIIVPIDMSHLLQPGSARVAPPSGYKPWGTGKVPSANWQRPAYRKSLLRRKFAITCTCAQEEDMSAPLVVSIPHQLGREEAMRRLKGGLSRAAASVPVVKGDEETWDDNRMMFRVRAMGQAATGNLQVADDHVRLEITLPWLLQRFADAAKAAITQLGNLLLTKR